MGQTLCFYMMKANTLQSVGPRAVYKEIELGRGLASNLLVCAVLHGRSGDPRSPQPGKPCSHFTGKKTEAQRSGLTGPWQGWVQTKFRPIPKLHFPPILHDAGSPQTNKGLLSEVTQFPLLSQPTSWFLRSLTRGPCLP